VQADAGVVSALPTDYQADQQDAILSATRWRVGDAHQERAGGYVHTYRLTAIAPHTNRTGYQSVLLYWRGSCVVCGGVLVALSGRRPKELARTCLAHRGAFTGKRVGGSANG